MKFAMNLFYIAFGICVAIAISAAAAPIGTYVANAIACSIDEISTPTVAEGGSGLARCNPKSILLVQTSDPNGLYVAPGGGGGGSTGDVNLTQVKGSAVDTNTGAASAATLRMVPATGSTIAATQSGVFTVQPGNTANTTPWLVTQTGALPTGAATIGAVNLAQYTAVSGRLPVDGSGVTQPVSIASLPALTAGSALIGGVNLAQVNASTVNIGTGNAGAGTPRVSVSTDSVLNINSLPAIPAGANTIGAVNLAQYTAVSGRLPVDGSGVTQPVSLATLPALATGAANAGYIICGNTTVKSREVTIANGDGARTNDSMVGTIATGTCVEVYGVAAATNSTTDVGLRVGFGASAVPTAALAGVDGMVFSHPGIAKNSGMVGGIGCSLLQTGASGEEVRMTTTAAPASSTTLAIILGYRTISC